MKQSQILDMLGTQLSKQSSRMAPSPSATTAEVFPADVLEQQGFLLRRELIPVGKLKSSPWQPHSRHSEEDIQSTLKSVESVGYLEDIAVRPLTGGDYEVMNGHKRLAIAQIRGDEALWGKVFNVSDDQALEIFMASNFKVTNFTEPQEMHLILSLLARQLIMSEKEVAQLITRGCKEMEPSSTSSIVIQSPEWKYLMEIYERVSKCSIAAFRAHRLPYLNMPKEVLDAVTAGKIPAAHGKAIAKVKDETTRQQLIERVQEEQLSVRDLQEQIKIAKGESTRVESPAHVKRLSYLCRRIHQVDFANDTKKQQRLEELLSELENLMGFRPE